MTKETEQQARERVRRAQAYIKLLLSQGRDLDATLKAAKVTREDYNRYAN